MHKLSRQKISKGRIKKWINIYHFRGGVESTTMCVLFGGDAKAIFADTGAEHKVLYDRLEFVENEIRRIHPNFEIIKIKGKDLKSQIFKYNYLPTPFARYCTRESKIEPIDKFLKEKGECTLMIGLNADEERTGNYGLNKNVIYDYPLQKIGFTRKKCEDLLHKVGLHPNFPAYMQRGGCIFCPFKSRKEYIAMSLLSPGEFEEVVQIEEKVQDKREDFFSINQGFKMRDLRDFASNNLFTPEEMYPQKYEVYTQCGVFCNR